MDKLREELRREILEDVREELKGLEDEVDRRLTDQEDRLESVDSASEALTATFEAAIHRLSNDLEKVHYHLFIDHELAKLTIPLRLRQEMEAARTRMAGLQLQTAVVSPALGLAPIDQPSVRTSAPDDPTVRRLSLTLANAISFYDASRTAPILTRPVLEYYAVNQLANFTTEFFFMFDHPASHHGLTMSGKDGYSTLSLRPSGAFQRYAVSLALLGKPNCASPAILSKGAGQYPECQPALNLKLPFKSSVDVEKLFTEEFLAFATTSTDYDEVTCQEFEDVSGIVIHYLRLFVASEWARYRPNLWARHVDGMDSEVLRHYRESSRKVATIFGSTKEVVDWMCSGQAIHLAGPPLARAPPLEGA